jgi:serine/threonine protein kinase
LLFQLIQVLTKLPNRNMGNSAPKKFSDEYDDVEVYFVRDVWKHFSKAYSLGSGTFGIVFAANPKPSKVSRAISSSGQPSLSRSNSKDENLALGTPPPMMRSSSNGSGEHPAVTPRRGLKRTNSGGSTGIESTATLSRPASHDTPPLTPQTSLLSLPASAPVSRSPSPSRHDISAEPDLLGASPMASPRNLTRTGTESKKKRSSGFPKINRLWTVDPASGAPAPEPPSPNGSPVLDDGNFLQPTLSESKEPMGRLRGSIRRKSPFGKSDRNLSSSDDESLFGNLKVAVKVITKSKDKVELKEQKEDFANEARVLKAISGGPHIVAFQGALVDKNHYCVVTDLCSGGELWSYLCSLPQQRFTEYECSKVTRQILLGIKHCHDKNVCHLDLKV